MSRLYICFLGYEFIVGGLIANTPNQTKTAEALHGTRDLAWGTLKRTDEVLDPAFADATMPVFIRFQPDLSEPLKTAETSGSLAANMYLGQSITLTNLSLVLKGLVVKTPGSPESELELTWLLPDRKGSPAPGGGGGASTRTVNLGPQSDNGLTAYLCNLSGK